MLFNSYSFIFVYLPITFVGMFWLAKRSHRLAALWLALASLAFYAVWDSRFLLLLLGSICFNYGSGRLISSNRKTGHARPLLIGAIAINLGILAYFKYTNFFIASVFGDYYQSTIDIILPLGISFFTFTQIAFLVDVYRDIACETNFIHYLLFVTWFPHLIAGPILHHKQMMPQFSKNETYQIDDKHIAAGLTIFVLGLVKKVLIADSLAEYATPVFTAAEQGQLLMLTDAWIGALTYTFQLYFDFSGYSDMAIGLSLLFNIHLPFNFNSPYKAISIIDFWKRWHITLSTFLRDYIYFPLGGNRKGQTRRYINLFITMLLGGLWHGAGWTFLIWGGLHGIYLTINHGWRTAKIRLNWSNGGRASKLASGALTFLAVVVAWVFFRANNITTAKSILAGMIGLHGVGMPEILIEPRTIPLDQTRFFPPTISDFPQNYALTHAVTLSLISICLILIWCFPNTRQIMQTFNSTWKDKLEDGQSIAPHINKLTQKIQWKPTKTIATLIGIIFAIIILKINTPSEFLYFQF